MATKKCCAKKCAEEQKSAFSTDEALAILRIAYLLSAVDGKITEDEQTQFSRVFEMLLGKDVLSDDAADFVSRLVDDGQNMLLMTKMLRRDNAIAKAFLKKVKNDVATLAYADTAEPIRAGFAVWLGMCCADGVYSPVERASISQIVDYLEEIGENYPNGIDSQFIDKVFKAVASLITVQQKYDAEDDEDMKECIAESVDAESALLRYIVANHDSRSSGGTPKRALKPFKK